MNIRIPDEFDSKFRFILVAAERAKQLLNGARPHMEFSVSKPATIAIREVEAGTVGFEVLEEDAEEDLYEEEG